MVQR
ncbi:unnamed protein product, partial [Didymodactylos carnosus]